MNNDNHTNNKFNKSDKNIGDSRGDDDVRCPVLKRKDACKFEAFRMLQAYFKEFNLYPDSSKLKKEKSEIYCCKIYD